MRSPPLRPAVARAHLTGAAGVSAERRSRRRRGGKKKYRRHCHVRPHRNRRRPPCSLRAAPSAALVRCIVSLCTNRRLRASCAHPCAAMSSSSSTSPEQPEAPAADAAAAPAVAAAARGGGRGGKKKEPPTPSVSYRALFRYATPLDLWLNALAIVAAAINGFIFPGFALLFGESSCRNVQDAAAVTRSSRCSLPALHQQCACSALAPQASCSPPLTTRRLSPRRQSISMRSGS